MKLLIAALLVAGVLLLAACGGGAHPNPCTKITAWGYPPMTFVHQVPDGAEVEVEGRRIVCEDGEAR